MPVAVMALTGAATEQPLKDKDKDFIQPIEELNTEAPLNEKEETTTGDDAHQSEVPNPYDDLETLVDVSYGSFGLNGQIYYQFERMPIHQFERKFFPPPQSSEFTGDSSSTTKKDPME